MAKFNLEIDGKNKSTTKGNVDWYYGGGDEAWVDIASAKAGVPLAVRNGKTVGVIESNKIVEYIWHNDDLTDNGLVLKTAGSNTTVEDVLTSSSTVNALSANQGKALKALIDVIKQSHFKGSFISITALNTAFPTASIGDYANVDTGAGSDAVRYIWDNDSTKWVLQLGVSTSITVEDILTSVNTSNALSANQGRILKDLISNNSPTLVSQITSGVTLGGITLSDVFSVGDSLESILRALLAAPLVLPSILSYNSLTLVGSTALVEVGALQGDTLTSVFTRGLIDNKDAHSNTYLTGASIGKVFSGTGIDAVTGILNTPAISGNNIWTATENYALGIDAYYDSLGNVASNLDANRVAGSIQKTLTRKGIYPFLYGVNSLILTGDTFLYEGVVKNLSEKSNKIIALNGTDIFIYFAYPASYGDLTKILDGNGFNVTSSFNKWNVNVTSTGLNTNWVNVPYIMYRTLALTTVNDNFTFQF